MAYFKNLFPELQEQDVRKPVKAPLSDEEERLKYENRELPQAAPVQQAPQAPAPQQEGPNVKAQYNKASDQKRQGLTEALKIATDVDAAGDQAALGGHQWGDPVLQAKDRDDLKNVIENLGKATVAPAAGAGGHEVASAAKFADDLRVIASRKTVDPAHSQKLLKAAALLDQAAQADKYIEGLRAPGQPLELTKQEAGQSAARLGASLSSQQQTLQGAGALRMEEQAPLMRQDLANQQRLTDFAGGAGGHLTDEPMDFNSALTASGWTKGDFMKRALGLQSEFGLNLSAAISPGAAGLAIANMLKSMGPVGQMLMVQMQKDAKGGQTTPGGGLDPNKKPGAEGAAPDPYEARIRDREMRFEQAFQELKQLKAFDSMWDVLFYVMFSVMMGPGPAAVLFTNKGKRGSLESELQMLQKEVEGLSRRQETHGRMQETARQHAAQQGNEDRRFKHMEKKDDFYMNLRQQHPAGKDPVLDNLMGGYRMWQDELDEAEKVLSNQFDFSDAEIKDARNKRARALPNVQTSRQNIIRYRAQNLQQAQGGQAKK